MKLCLCHYYWISLKDPQKSTDAEKAYGSIKETTKTSESNSNPTGDPTKSSIAGNKDSKEADIKGNASIKEEPSSSQAKDTSAESAYGSIKPSMPTSHADENIGRGTSQHEEDDKKNDEDEHLKYEKYTGKIYGRCYFMNKFLFIADNKNNRTIVLIVTPFIASFFTLY